MKKCCVYFFRKDIRTDLEKYYKKLRLSVNAGSLLRIKRIKKEGRSPLIFLEVRFLICSIRVKNMQEAVLRGGRSQRRGV